ncbi:MAG TPA: NADH-quinone oxidoreductase subunit NuoF [Candidatus Manganitrophaceae bacterium]|nr:NADH-quinone oxidoreductase subunit NuoF [Candidatus Manganitrophaceae bacterium]
MVKSLRVLTEKDIPLNFLSTIRPMEYHSYVQKGGYFGLSRAVQLSPPGVLEEVKKSGLRGRGGAGFPTWKKWEMVVQQKEKRKYLCCNAAEDEPGTFKDRYLLRANPHQLIEGAIISAYAIGADEAYLYINGRFEEELQFMEEALQKAKDQGHWGRPMAGSGRTIELKITRSPGTYVAGEETALLEVIEGRVAAPRQKPPYYPAVHGLFGKPTAVNNAETLSNVPHIIREGAEWFRAIGTATSPGSLIFTLTGDVNRPGLYELPLGTSLRDLIEVYGKGVKDGKKLKAVFPGGPSNTIIPADQIDVPLDFDSLKAIGSGLGTGAVIVMSEEVCMVRAAIEYARFFSRESCGQCPPCKLGTVHLSEILEKIESGHGTEKEVKQVEQVCGMIKGRGYCYLLTGASIAVESIFKHFQPEFEAHVQEAKCPAASEPILSEKHE